MNAKSGGEDISVCLLVYNHALVLPETIDSILDQTIGGFEFLISDDCSTDDSWKLIRNKAASHPEIRAIQTPRNLGMCGNANYAVAHSTRPYIALLHHDDLYQPDLLERWLQVIKLHDDVSFTFNEYYSGTSRIPVHKGEGQSFPEVIGGRSFLEKVLFSRWGCAVRGTAMIRRSCWEAMNGLREEFGMLADIDLWMRLSARWNVGYVSAPLITVRNERPDYYPAEYRAFSWFRQKLLYSIHANNHSSYYKEPGLRNWCRWMHFRLSVSLETLKWLTYAVLRRRRDIITESLKGECPWEFRPVKWLRRVLLTATA